MPPVEKPSAAPAAKEKPLRATPGTERTNPSTILI
jgi:hypothetical protein